MSERQSNSKPAERDARQFLNKLYHGRPEPSVIVVTHSTNGKWHPSHFPLTTDDALVRVLGVVDVYVRITPIAHKPPKGGRGTAAASIALPGVWADFDVNGTPSANGKLVTAGCPDFDSALALSRCVLEPTLLVKSGGGLHAYYLFDRMWPFKSPDERALAASLVKRFQERLRAEARDRHGVTKFDPTQDLARVLRPPGSVNGKMEGNPRPVELLDCDGRRHTVEAIEAIAVPVSTNGHTRQVAQDDGAGRPVAELLAAFPKLAHIAAHEGNPPQDASDSGWDNYLAHEAARGGLSDAEIGALIRHSRHDDTKSRRTDYIGRTVARARAAVAADEPDPAKRISDRWRLRDRIVSGTTLGDVAGGTAKVYLTCASGTVLRFSRLSDLFEPRKHNRIVSQVTRSRFPALSEKEATEIAQRVIELCGGVDADPCAVARGWVSEFIAQAGEVVQATENMSKWETFRAHAAAEAKLTSGRSPARRSAFIRRGNEVLLPAGALKEHSATGKTWDEFKSDMEEIGFVLDEVDVREPGTRAERSAGVKNGRVHRNFYVGPE